MAQPECNNYWNISVVTLLCNKSVKESRNNNANVGLFNFLVNVIYNIIKTSTVSKLNVCKYTLKSHLR